jgi:hypothetical protein
MGWNNPANMSWGDLEARLSGRPRPQDPEAPISTRKHQRDDTVVTRPSGPLTPYAELHCHSSFSFLDGASGPDKLVQEAVRLGLHARSRATTSVGQALRVALRRGQRDAPLAGTESVWIVGDTSCAAARGETEQSERENSRFKLAS